MGRTPRERFRRERGRVEDLGDGAVREALLGFADAIDPEVPHAEAPTVENGRLSGRESKSNSTAKGYLSALRCAHQRGLGLLEADAETVNDFMADLVTEPENRRHDLVEFDGSITKPTAKSWQSALRGFYRWATEPGASEDRPEARVEWPADDIRMFSERSTPKHDSEDLPDQADLDALREACIDSQNTRRDRAFLELAAGTGQRVYALVTLRVKDVALEGDRPHILLNPEIEGDGDKGAIEEAGRWRPIVTDPGPIRQWIKNHPLRGSDKRAEYGAPEDFEDCYLFVGSVSQRSTDAASHWSAEAARNMLDRRAEHTENLPGVKTADVSANPHNWRHYAYTQSQDIPDLDEPTRRKVFGWSPGSDTGERLYGHETGKKAGQRFADAWQSHYGDGDAESVAEQVVGADADQRLSPEARSALIDELTRDEQARKEFAESLGLYTPDQMNQLFRTSLAGAFDQLGDQLGLEIDGAEVAESAWDLSGVDDDGNPLVLQPAEE